MHCQSDESLRKLEPYKITKILPGTYKKLCICYQYILNCILLINEYYMFISMEWNRNGNGIGMMLRGVYKSTLVHNRHSNTRNKHKKDYVFIFLFSFSLAGPRSLSHWVIFPFIFLHPTQHSNVFKFPLRKLCVNVENREQQ